MHKAPDKLKEREVNGGNKYSESTYAVARYAPPRTAPNVNLTSGFADTKILDMLVSDRIHGTLEWARSQTWRSCGTYKPVPKTNINTGEAIMTSR